MSLASQAKDLAKQGAVMRLELFGVNQAGDPQIGRMQENDNQFETFTCYHSPVRSHEQLDEAMFKDVHDSIVRVAKTEQYFTATIGKNFILFGAKSDGSDLILRISEMGHSGLNPEYVIGCKAVF